MSFDPVAFSLWPAVLVWLQVVGVSLALALVVGFGGAVASHGFRGFGVAFGEIVAGFRDLFSLSLGRIYALAKLTFLEAIRRKALLVFVVFAILFMFAGWFITDTGQKAALQVKVHVIFVTWTLSTLSLVVVMLLACWGIPEDIRVRSIHTVVTKPARRLEIVLGRILGFSGIATVVLAVMASVGYVWLNRQVPPESQSELTCRRPIYGAISFLDRTGDPAKFGINVGDTWMFRSYIEGSSKARAIWNFPGVSASSLDADENLQLESRFQAFRSHKGTMDRQLLYRFEFVNPEKELRVPYKLMEVAEFIGSTETVPRKIRPDGGVKEYDLINDLVDSKGNLQVEVSCVDPGQYLGMARPDLFIRTPDAPFLAGYFKSVVGIWLMLLLVVILGVSASTFVKGPVATLLTFCIVVIGQVFRELLDKVAKGTQEGGGLFESIYRLIAHMNPTTPVPDGLATQVMKTVDRGLENLLWVFRQILPDFSYFNMAPYIANGFDVPFDAAVLPSIVVVMAYFIPCVIIAYYSLRLRELEAK